MSMLLFNIYMDGVIGESYGKMHDSGVKRIDKNQIKILVIQLLFSKATALLT